MRISETPPVVPDGEMHTAARARIDDTTVASEAPKVAVSVIIPAFNAAGTIRRALESLQAQTLGAWEAIVVDDASTDNSPLVIEDMARNDGRIMYVRNPQNSGPAQSRNRGIALASGAWIGLLDADDAFATERLSELLSIANRSQADVVSDNLLVVDQLTTKQRLLFDPREFATPRPMSLVEFVQGCSFDPQKPPRSSYTLMQPIVKRAFLRRKGITFPSDCRNGEDLIFNLNLLSAGARWVVTSVPMSTYFVTRGSQAEIVRDHDRQAMWASVRTLLHRSETRRDPMLAKTLQDYLRIAYYLYWSGLIKQSVKRRSARMVLTGLMHDHTAFWPFAREALYRSPRLFVREVTQLWARAHAVRPLR